MKPQIWNMPITQVIDYRYSRLIHSFSFYSDILGYLCIIPRNFIIKCDSTWKMPNVPKLMYNYLCRKDSIPNVTKKQAADVYLEFLKYRGTSYMIRYAKYWTVKMTMGYFHKHDVFDTYKELTE